jgi:hypothetical protein
MFRRVFKHGGDEQGRRCRNVCHRLGIRVYQIDLITLQEKLEVGVGLEVSTLAIACNVQYGQGEMHFNKK